MKPRRLKAKFKGNLIVFGEPMLLSLTIGKRNALALAIDRRDLSDSDYIVTTVTDKNWWRYLDGYVDLRYLFTYPFQRRTYSFAESDWSNNEVMVRPFDGDLKDALLPEHGLFSKDHTEPFEHSVASTDQERLHIDGEWELDEFGNFYQKYSDLYAISAVISNHSDPNTPQAYKSKAASAFTNRPYKGGSSYMHVFGDLIDCVPKGERLGLEGIVYNSPGDVRMLGETEHFTSVERLLTNFIEKRSEIREKHKSLRAYLTKNKFLTLPASGFAPSNPHAAFILAESTALAELLSVKDLSSLSELCGQNNLVFSKVILAIYRRVETAAGFFAEGRMAFD